MISREEYQFLYEKNLSGLCSPKEIELLNDYQDEVTFIHTGWENEKVDKHDVQARIWKRLNENRNIAAKPIKSKSSNFIVLKIAAILLIATFVSVIFLSRKWDNVPFLPSVARMKHQSIRSGGDKAILTMANGSTITLTDAKNGKLFTQNGIQISKAKDGILEYKYNADKRSINNIGNNTITTPRGGQYQVVLSDGTKVWLNAASSLRFPVTFTGNFRKVELTGEAYFEVAKNKAKPFILNANRTNVQVLGTHFNVSAYADDAAVTTTLLEGSVRLVKAETIVMLKPGEQGTSLNNQTAIKIEKADIEQVMAWKNGYFLFDNTDIRSIMKQAARWYDVDVVYQGLANKYYGGKISKYKDINELLKNLELTGTIHFTVEGRRVTVIL